MTPEDFRNLVLRANTAFCVRVRLLQKRLENDYSSLMGEGFKTAKGIADAATQNKASIEREYNEGLRDIRKDIFAEFYAPHGFTTKTDIAGIEVEMPSLPPSPPPPSVRPKLFIPEPFK